MTDQNAKAPQSYSAEEIGKAIADGRFFLRGQTVEQSIAFHLQAALEKGFDLGRRVDPTSENARLRQALLRNVYIWDDPSSRDFRLCRHCHSVEGEKHKPECVLA